MQALTLPASRGWLWFFEGYRLFRKNPIMLSLLVLSYGMLMLFVGSVPVLGQVVATVVLPAFSVSLMNACRVVERGGALAPQLLFSGFKERRQTLLVLGAAYLAAAALILGASALIDGGVLFSFFATGRGTTNIDEGALLAAAQFALVLFAPLTMAYWFAPVLVAWHDLSAAKSLFFSFVACARNWRAFVTYSLAVLIFVGIGPGLALALLRAALPGDLAFVPKALSFLIVAVLAPTLYASFYVSYREVLVRGEDDV